MAALYGFRRNCGDNRILARGNREGHALKAVKAVEDVLKLENKAMFVSKAKSTDEILEAAEYWHQYSGALRAGADVGQLIGHSCAITGARRRRSVTNGKSSGLPMTVPFRVKQAIF